MGTPGPQKIHRYGVEFKLKAVQMSHQPGVLIKDVAESLCIHPFVLSKWRKQVRDGVFKGCTQLNSNIAERAAQQAPFQSRGSRRFESARVSRACPLPV